MHTATKLTKMVQPNERLLISLRQSVALLPRLRRSSEISRISASLATSSLCLPFKFAVICCHTLSFTSSTYIISVSSSPRDFIPVQ
jgi:hypothetical protein